MAVERSDFDVCVFPTPGVCDKSPTANMNMTAIPARAVDQFSLLSPLLGTSIFNTFSPGRKQGAW